MSGLRKDCNTMDGERLKSGCKWLISRSIAVIAKVGPIITIKANIDATVKEIRGALTDTQVQIFKKTCFGHWLDISLKRNNQLLIHTLLTCMVDSVANELSFLVSGKRIRFRRQEFCLVTGLRFGSNMYMKEWVKNMAENSFRNRIFPDIEARSVKLSDVIAIFDKMRGKSLVLEDNDAVKICLLVLLQHGFLGHQMSHNISNEMLMLVEDLSNCKGVQSKAVSKQLEIEKDSLREEVQKKKKKKKKRKRGSHHIIQNPTYEQLMTRVSTLEGTVTTLTQTVSSLQGSIGTLESRLFALEGTIATLESRLLALEGDERDFGVVSDGDIAAYSRTPLKLKSPMRCYSRKSRNCTIPPPPASTTMPPVTTTKKLLKDTHLDDSDAAKDAAKDTHLDVVTTISIPMTTIEKTLKDIIHIDASDPIQETRHRHTEDEFKIIRIETTTKKPSYDLPYLTKIRRCKYPIFTTFEKEED
ncbi:phospholipase-like protein [Tanacetum coccineum]|uniref:Phospholipase-like protein n=1 Tax=Tanacetum coccineum TaxID=301880 RepID=A0ABQ5ERL2_9ASTR